MIKTLSKVRIEGTYLNTVKAIYDTPIANIIFNGQKIQVFTLRLGTRQRRLLSPLLCNIVMEVLATAISQEEEIKGIQILKEKVKLSLFADDIIMNIENPKDSTKNQLELINSESSRIQYKLSLIHI